MIGAAKAPIFDETLYLGRLDDGRHWLVVTYEARNVSSRNESLKTGSIRLVAGTEEIREAGSETNDVAEVLGLRSMGGFVGTPVEPGESVSFVHVFKVDPAASKHRLQFDFSGKWDIDLNPYLAESEGTATSLVPPATPTPLPSPTSTPRPTSTPSPSQTPTPRPAPSPTPTSTPTATPVMSVRSGSLYRGTRVLPMGGRPQRLTDDWTISVRGFELFRSLGNHRAGGQFVVVYVDVENTGLRPQSFPLDVFAVERVRDHASYEMQLGPTAEVISNVLDAELGPFKPDAIYSVAVVFDVPEEPMSHFVFTHVRTRTMPSDQSLFAFSFEE